MHSGIRIIIRPNDYLSKKDDKREKFLRELEEVADKGSELIFEGISYSFDELVEALKAYELSHPKK